MMRHIFLFVMILFFCACSPERKVTGEAGVIKISTGSYTVTAREVRPVDASFMIVGWMKTIGLKGYQDATVMGIPVGRAESLKRTYGDFMRCDNPGAEEAKGSVVQVDIILSSLAYKSTLGQARELQARYLYPVIRVTGKEIAVSRAECLGLPMSSSGKAVVTLLADKVELVQENYGF